MNIRRLRKILIYICIVVAALSVLNSCLNGCNKDEQTSLIAEIQTHILVPGESHSGLWLGPGMFFKPGHLPHDFHIFISETDRKGGDSAKNGSYFTVDSLPANDEDFAEWWKKWQEQPFPSELASRIDDVGYEWVPSFNWKYHKKSGNWLGIGHLLRQKDKRLSNHRDHLAITYSVFNANTKVFSNWKSFHIRIDGEEKPCVAYGQRVDLENGDILLPFSTIKKYLDNDSYRWCGSVYCKFDGKELQPIKVSKVFTNPVIYGFVEPSMAFYDGRFYMSLRTKDGYGYFVTSKNGMNWGEPRSWCWDDGTPIGMYHTMIKFITHSDGLFLVYTRISKDNDNVFRHRAPLFIARIDTKKTCLVRDSEQIIFSNKGLPMGNFHIYDVSPQECWVTVPEWDRTGRDIPCDILLGRIIWGKSNKKMNL